MNIAYIRVSHIESLNGTSLDTQEKRCRAFSELHGFKIDKVYSEIVSGGVEFRKRKVFQKVLKELGSNGRLVVSRLDRLSRSVLQTLQLVEDFKKSHNQLCITDIGNVHTDGVSKVFITILASLAEIERVLRRTLAEYIDTYMMSMSMTARSTSAPTTRTPISGW